MTLTGVAECKNRTKSSTGLAFLFAATQLLKGLRRMKIFRGFLSIALLTFFSTSLVVGADAPPAEIKIDSQSSDEIIVYDTFGEYSKLHAIESTINPEDLVLSGPQPKALVEEDPAGENSVLSLVCEYNDFGYWAGYPSQVGNISIAPYLYGYYYSYYVYYAYGWQPTTFTFADAATSVSMGFYYGGTLLAYDTAGNYLGQASSYGQGWWHDVTFTAPAGTTIGHVVAQSSYGAYSYYYSHHMTVCYEDNQAPVAAAGADQSFDCVVASQDVVLDGSGSSDPDADALSYSWSGAFGTATGVNPTISLGGGSHTITLTVDDGNGGSASDDLIVTVVLDTEAPELDAPADISVYANVAGGFSGLIGDAIALDACDPDPMVSNDAPVLFLLGDTEVTYTAVDESGNSSNATQLVTVEPFPVTVDIKPGSANNSINPRSKGVIPVAILSDANFDATTIDVSSLSFGPGGAATAHSGHIEDVDDDGDDDLMLHFRTQASGVSNSDVALCLTGFTQSGIPLAGCDGINGNSLSRPIGDVAEATIPNNVDLEQNYPNPFNPSTVIGYSLPEASNVSLVVYNMRGAVIATLVNDYKNAGSYQVEFDGSAFSSGTYLYVLNTNGVRSIKRFSLMK